MASVVTLVPGDVLVFRSDGSHVDRIITILTNSDVAHSALLYQNDVLVDAASGCGIAAHTMRVMPSGPTAPAGATPLSRGTWIERDIYVRRLNRLPVPQDVFDAARAYANQNNGFNYMGLIAVGLHLLLRMDLPLGKVAELLVELLGMLTGELEKLMRPRPGSGTKGPHPMFCSQFVYQCFMDGGRELEMSSGSQRFVPSPALLDRIAASSVTDAILNGKAGPPPRLRHRSADEIAADLLAALSSDVAPTATSAVRATHGPGRDLIWATLEFGRALQQVQGVSGSMDLRTGLGFLGELRKSYVTPADLCYNCTNLAGTQEVLGIQLKEASYPI